MYMRLRKKKQPSKAEGSIKDEQTAEQPGIMKNMEEEKFEESYADRNLVASPSMLTF